MLSTQNYYLEVLDHIKTNYWSIMIIQFQKVNSSTYTHRRYIYYKLFISSRLLIIQFSLNWKLWLCIYRGISLVQIFSPHNACFKFYDNYKSMVKILRTKEKVLYDPPSIPWTYELIIHNSVIGRCTVRCGACCRAWKGGHQTGWQARRMTASGAGGAGRRVVRSRTARFFYKFEILL